MYEIVKSVITSGRYVLSEMLKKIDTLWVQGDLRDDQHTELIQLARDHADPVMSVDLLRAIEALDKRVTALEQGGAPTPEPDPSEPHATEEFPAYDKNHGYVTGEKCTHQGKRYICNLPDHTSVCWFSPSAYPDYWQAV